MDIVVSHIDLKATPALLRNDGGNQHHWLGISLIGANGPVSAVGAKVTLTSDGRTQVRVNQWATSYLSYNDPRVHFGLGDNTRIDHVTVRWPNGQTEIFKELKADRYVTLKQGTGAR